ncbi:membrane-spanning 4-domains subfamily A member 8 isoform X1 [Desmodus rotundus]|uniref:membrane-spanning 4-domains subfamily A member 8 isoform X1 n=1 Tax=Desmodus rotundus TaxID=9430 RepID=UPI002380C4CE|nr:membrane-spanning 4-domains subfamily A member 8 isoform X1 [Desmodus rotundus]XP_053781552.1 membrane-spanning 4-domains subfamily A member 8 isoform X1 [Desmodus rotundus]
MAADPTVYIVIREPQSQEHWYPLNQPQTTQTPGRPPVLKSAEFQRVLKESKTLGALQILIGLIYIGLGSILGTILLGNYSAPSFEGGIPFWGGMLFIISGSLSVSLEQEPNSLYLLWSFIITNIFSAIMSVIGISLFITEIIVNSPYKHLYSEVFSGLATSGVLLIFSLLELWITFTCAIFGYQRRKSFMETQNGSKANQVDTEQPGNLYSADPTQVQDSQ